MFVAVVVTLCHLLQPGVEACHEQIAADTDSNPGLTWFGCVTGGPQGLADWKANSEFSDDSWRIAKWRCVPDRSYNLKGRA